MIWFINVVVESVVEWFDSNSFDRVREATGGWVDLVLKVSGVLDLVCDAIWVIACDGESYIVCCGSNGLAPTDTLGNSARFFLDTRTFLFGIKGWFDSTVVWCECGIASCS